MQPPRHILVLAEGQLGDLILLTPALRGLRDSFPDVRITAVIMHRRRYGSSGGVLVSAGSRSGTAIVLSSLVDETIEIDRSLLRSLGPVARAVAEAGLLRLLRRLRCDTALCTFPQDRFVLWALASGARWRTGERDQPLRFLLTHRPSIRKEQGGVLRYHCALAESIGATVSSYRTEVPVTRDHRDRAARTLASHGFADGAALVAIHPGASGGFNIWPPERFGALADGVREQGLAHVVLCGSPYDRDAMDAVRRALRRPVPVLEFGEDVLDMAAVFERCSVVVCNNSGPWHVAQAVGSASVVFLSHYRDQAWNAYRDNPRCCVLEGEGVCPACPEGECKDIVPSGERFGTTCLRQIGPEAALRAVSRLLGRI